MKNLNWYEIVCTWFGLGKSPIMPGTVGSLGAFPLFYFSVMSSVTIRDAQITMLFFIVVLSIIGYIAIEKYHKKHQVVDASAIVIDEVIGQMIALCIGYEYIGKAFMILFPHVAITSPALSITYMFLCGFATFRFFDIKKPFYISKIDKYMKNSAGVILDDVLAGIYAGLVFWLFR